jgi:hypothetical protein
MEGAEATSGKAEIQDLEFFGNQWSENRQLWWRPSEAGAALTLHLPAPADGEYELIAYLTKAPDYGKVRISLGETALGEEINLYDPHVVPSGAITLGRMSLKAGTNPLRIQVTGKDDRSRGFLVGVDAFVLKKVNP